MSVKYVFAPGTANELTLTDADIVRHDPVHTHTGKGDFELEVPYNRNLDQFVQRKDRVNVFIDGSAKFAGYCKDIRHDGVYVTSSGDTGTSTVLTGDGIAKRLEETRPDYESIGGPVSYSNIALEDAIDDYWSRTPFGNYTVYPQPTEEVATGVTVHDADTTAEWESITNPPADKPVIAQNDGFESTQICWTTEGENYDIGNEFRNTDPNDLADYSGGDGAYLSRDSAATGGQDFAEWDFTVNHEISSDNFGCQIRLGSGSVNAPAFDFELIFPDSSRFTIDSNSNVGVTLGGVEWVDIGNGFFDQTDGYTGPDLPPGDYKLRADVTDSNGTADTYYLYVDVVAPYDQSFSSQLTFDDDNGGSSGYLDGPELYPSSVTAESTESQVSQNITTSDITSTWNDTSNNQSISVSNDGGASYTQFDNTDTVSHTYSSAGRSARFKLTFSRHGSRTTATPQQGFNNQAVDSLTHTVDLNDLTVIDSLELSRDHFSNLQTLHEYGSYLWSINHDDSSIANMLVESFERGSQTKPAPDGFDLQENKQAEINAKDYYNKIYLEGQKRDDGTRPTAEVEDSTAIANDGREITPGVLRDLNITTEAGAEFRAQAILDKALNKQAVRGQVTAAPAFPFSGYAYPVDFGNGEQNITAEEVELTEGTDSIQARYDFVDRTDLSREIADLKRTNVEQGNQV